MVEARQADVLGMKSLPDTWAHYDLILSASMLSTFPRTQLPEALAGLRRRLAETGHLVVFITRRNWLTRPLIGRWWRSNLYKKEELLEAFRQAGFTCAAVRGFPLAVRHLAAWGHVVEARK